MRVRVAAARALLPAALALGHRAQVYGRLRDARRAAARPHARSGNMIFTWTSTCNVKYNTLSTPYLFYKFTYGYINLVICPNNLIILLL